MARLERIRGLTRHAAKALRTRTGLATVEAVWRRLATPRLGEELAALAKSANLSTEELRELLAEDAAGRTLEAGPFATRDEPRLAGTGRLRRHLADAFAAVVLVVLVAGLSLALARIPPAGQAVVAATALAADRVLTDADLTIAELRAGDGIASIGDAVGHIVLHPLAEGEVVRQADLGPAVDPAALVVRLPLAPQSLALRPEQTVSLILPREDEPPEVIARALVLRVDADAASFALDAGDRDALARLPPGAAVRPFLPPRIDAPPRPRAP